MVLDFLYDLGEKGQGHNMSYYIMYVVLILSADIRDDWPPSSWIN